MVVHENISELQLHTHQAFSAKCDQKVAPSYQLILALGPREKAQSEIKIIALTDATELADCYKGVEPRLPKQSARRPAKGWI